MAYVEAEATWWHMGSMHLHLKTMRRRDDDVREAGNGCGEADRDGGGAC